MVKWFKRFQHTFYVVPREVILHTLIGRKETRFEGQKKAKIFGGVCGLLSQE
jgi:hypothetical protein